MLKRIKILLPAAVVVLCLAAFSQSCFAAVAEATPIPATDPLPGVNINLNGEGSDAVRIILLLTVLTVAPSILMMTTCFTRIVVVFSFMRSAIGLQQTPPNQVLIGLALCVTMFVMSPVLSEINEEAYKPYEEGDISSSQFIERASAPLKRFMLKQVDAADVRTFASLAEQPIPEDPMELSMGVVTSSFITSELKRAFTIGFLLYIPFLIIDMVVSSTLMSMGMIMLPPAMIAMPFKIMLFVLVDGWGLLVRTIVLTIK